MSAAGIPTTVVTTTRGPTTHHDAAGVTVRVIAASPSLRSNAVAAAAAAAAAVSHVATPAARGGAGAGRGAGAGGGEGARAGATRMPPPPAVTAGPVLLPAPLPIMPDGCELYGCGMVLPQRGLAGRLKGHRLMPIPQVAQLATDQDTSVAHVAAGEHQLAVTTGNGQAFVWRQAHGGLKRNTEHWFELRDPLRKKLCCTALCGHDLRRGAGAAGIDLVPDTQPDVFKGLALAEDGRLLDLSWSSTEDQPRVVPFPRQLPPGEVVADVAGGELRSPADPAFVAVISQTGRLYMSVEAQQTERTVSEPVAVAPHHPGTVTWPPAPLGLHCIVKVSLGVFPNAIALNNRGQAFLWSQRGGIACEGPVPFRSARLVDVAADPTGPFFAAVQDSGSVIHFGFDSEGNQTGVMTVPPPIGASKFISISLGAGCAAAVTDHGDLYTWVTATTSPRPSGGDTSQNLVPPTSGAPSKPYVAVPTECPQGRLVSVQCTARSIIVVVQTRKRVRARAGPYSQAATLPLGKKPRTGSSGCRRFTTEARNRLEALYKANSEPTNDAIYRMSQDLNESELRIRTWFSNRRAKDTLLNLNRRRRRRLSASAKVVLEAAYAESSQADAARLDRLARETDETVERVKNWFSNQRAKHKRPGDNVKRRMRFSRDDLALLQEAYGVSRHPKKETLQDLATQLRATPVRVRNWFANRRARENTPKTQDGRRRPSTEAFRQAAEAANPHRAARQRPGVGRKPRGYKKIHPHLSFDRIEDVLNAAHGVRHVTGFFKFDGQPYSVCFTASKIGTGLRVDFNGLPVAVVPPSADVEGALPDTHADPDAGMHEAGGEAVVKACSRFGLKTATPLSVCKVLVYIAIELTFDGGPTPVPCIKHGMQIKPDIARQKLDSLVKYHKRASLKPGGVTIHAVPGPVIASAAAAARSVHTSVAGAGAGAGAGGLARPMRPMSAAVPAAARDVRMVAAVPGAVPAQHSMLYPTYHSAMVKSIRDNNIDGVTSVREITAHCSVDSVNFIVGIRQTKDAGGRATSRLSIHVSANMSHYPVLVFPSFYPENAAQLKQMLGARAAAQTAGQATLSCLATALDLLAKPGLRTSTGAPFDLRSYDHVLGVLPVDSSPSLASSCSALGPTRSAVLISDAGDVINAPHRAPARNAVA